MIIYFPGVRPTNTLPQYTRRRAFAPHSLHTHRRALLRRAGMSCCAERPAIVMDTIVRALLEARA